MKYNNVDFTHTYGYGIKSTESGIVGINCGENTGTAVNAMIVIIIVV